MRKNIINKKWQKRLLLYIGLLILAAIWFTPILTIILTSLKSKSDYFNSTGLFSIPDKIHWQNFSEAMRVGRLGIYMKNGLIISFAKVPLGIFIEALAAFAITRLNVKFKTGIFLFFLFGMMVPMQITLVPINIMYRSLNLHNTYFGLFYAYVAFGTGFGILILRGFFRTIPSEIDEAATVDGCNKFMLFSRIILPMAKPAIATLFIIDFLGTWNEFLLSSIIINDNKMKTVSTGLMTFVGEHSTEYGLLAAGVLISIVPVLVVFLFFQRYFVEGLSGAIKS